MKEHKSLLFFIFGILFYEIILPILSEIATVISGSLQLIQGKQAVKMTEYNEAVEKYKASLNKEEIETNCIGFQVPVHEDDWEEDDE